MRLFAQCLICFLLFTIGYLLFTVNIYAAGEFTTNYKVVYTVDVNGSVTAVQDITLLNNTPNYYADKFELKIGSIKVEGVKAHDDLGPLEVKVNSEDNITSITVKFNQKVIGTAKNLPFTLSYTSPDLAVKSGQIWEISIPRIVKNPEIASYEADVITPASFGKTANITPDPKSQAREGNLQVFTFEKSQLEENGISMSFGTKQVFSFSLDYFLENNNLTSQVQEITLPPDNNYQKVVLSDILPRPLNTSIDSDGNFLAKYRLAPKTSLKIKATGYVEVFAKPQEFIQDKLSPQERRQYTQPHRYWETDQAEIKEKAKEFDTPSKIYDFVTDFLKYDEDKLSLDKIERLGALGALAKPDEAVCMEFSDLFIAIARGAGIPAKEIIGFAYTQNSRLKPLSLTSEGDLLHAWPAFWDDARGWIQVDPTWGSTAGGIDYFNKMDFNHITLIQRGLSSTYPPPAGSFKRAGEEAKKDVDIGFADELPVATAISELSLTIPEKIFSGIPTKVQIKIKNAGTSSIIGQKLSVGTGFLTVSGKLPEAIAILPPLAQIENIIKLQNKGFFAQKNDTLIVKFADTEIARPVRIVPFYFLLFSPFLIFSSLVACILIASGLFVYQKVRKK